MPVQDIPYTDSVFSMHSMQTPNTRHEMVGPRSKGRQIRCIAMVTPSSPMRRLAQSETGIASDFLNFVLETIQGRGIVIDVGRARPSAAPA